MFEELFTWVSSNYGYVWGIPVFLILVALKYIEDIKKVFYAVKSWFRKVFIIKEYHKPSDILHAKISYWVDFKIPNININDPGRKKLFTDLLKYKFEAVQKNIDGLSKSEGFEELNEYQLYETIVKCVHKIQSEYRGKAIEEGIPVVVLDKFAKWHIGTLTYLLSSVEVIALSGIYKNNKEKIQAIYSLHTAILDVTIAEAERSLDELNGELSGIKYKGRVCL